MNKSNVRKLARHLRNRASYFRALGSMKLVCCQNVMVGFHTAYFTIDRNDPDAWLRLLLHQIEPCGSVGCIAGEAKAVFGHLKAQYTFLVPSEADALAYHLDIDPRHISKLTILSHWPLDWRSWYSRVDGRTVAGLRLDLYENLDIMADYLEQYVVNQTWPGWTNC